MANISNTETKLPTFSALELESRVTVKRAAEIKGVSEDTFRRNHRHLIEQLSKRRQGVKLKNVIADSTTTERDSTAA